MTEELQKALTEILNGVLTAKDFMLAELPEVVQQLLLWKTVISLVWFSLFMLIAIAMSCYTKKFFQRLEATIVFIVSISHYEWLQIWLAPKVYLIEYVASLAK